MNANNTELMDFYDFLGMPLYTPKAIKTLDANKEEYEISYLVPLETNDNQTVKKLINAIKSKQRFKLYDRYLKPTLKIKILKIQAVPELQNVFSVTVFAVPL